MIHEGNLEKENSRWNVTLFLENVGGTGRRSLGLENNASREEMLQIRVGK